MRKTTDLAIARGRWDAKNRRKRNPSAVKGGPWQRRQYRKGYRQALREMRREGWA